MTIEISVAIIAFAFVLLVIYLLTLICTLRVTLRQAGTTLEELQKRLKDAEGDAKTIVENTRLISSNLVKKMEALDPLFYAVANTGEYFEKKTDCLRASRFSARKFRYLHPRAYDEEKKSFESEKFAEIADLIGAGIRLWQTFNRR